MNTNQNSTQSYVDEYAPPQVTTAMTPDPNQSPISNMQNQTAAVDTATVASASTEPATQSLEDQNIFVMLGVLDGADKEKEAFLDELQQVIWEDFLEYDVKLLITTEEMTQLQQIMSAQYQNDLEKQEKIIVFLEKLIPDLEDIMLEKALELKADMFFERIEGLKEFYVNDQAKLEMLRNAESLAKSDRWSDAVSALATINL